MSVDTRRHPVVGGSLRAPVERRGVRAGGGPSVRCARTVASSSGGRSASRSRRLSLTGLRRSGRRARNGARRAFRRPGHRLSRAASARIGLSPGRARTRAHPTRAGARARVAAPAPFDPAEIASMGTGSGECARRARPSAAGARDQDLGAGPSANFTATGSRPRRRGFGRRRIDLRMRRVRRLTVPVNHWRLGESGREEPIAPQRVDSVRHG